MARSLGAPFTLSGPRETVMPMSAFDSRLLTGLAFLPDELTRRGGVEAGADGAERHRDRRDHVGGACHRRQRRQRCQLGERGRRRVGRRHEAVERPQRARKTSRRARPRRRRPCETRASGRTNGSAPLPHRRSHRAFRACASPAQFVEAGILGAQRRAAPASKVSRIAAVHCAMLRGRHGAALRRAVYPRHHHSRAGSARARARDCPAAAQYRAGGLRAGLGHGLHRRLRAHRRAAQACARFFMPTSPRCNGCSTAMCWRLPL